MVDALANLIESLRAWQGAVELPAELEVEGESPTGLTAEIRAAMEASEQHAGKPVLVTEGGEAVPVEAPPFQKEVMAAQEEFIKGLSDKPESADVEAEVEEAKRKFLEDQRGE